ncbi:hypothetical protein [Acinetobacter baumannii]|uniref:hypothetical protein n=1 Tax=Acinetobacter baumannii TaxID=470 RepID=UPI0005B6F623|nr:hypothetical protein [Acinetobacter baumannii]KIQ72515.1 hypothetical protein SE99_02907 [Acinetobacter baumannii]MBZ0484192.1 hypothetical protein [Acinetobacter baumannii]MDP7939726.1 hypothetical protein [Acinetobacter baumannii]MDY7273768.1 hypothetical protein [Acinetobacter baumannii]MDY7417334.1 hypothetical protein [Acinetobacter baumannii]
MTVQVSDRLSQLYVGNGINTRFDFTFRAFEQEDETGIGVRVKVGNDFEFIDESEYAVTLNPDNLGGYVTFVEPPSAVTFFYIAGKTPVDQLLDITNYDNFYPDAIERALDKLTAILQEWKHLVDFETQARNLADIDYDELAKQREADLKSYIDGIASAVIGNPVIGLPSKYVVEENGRTQREINNQYLHLTDFKHLAIVGLADGYDWSDAIIAAEAEAYSRNMGLNIPSGIYGYSKNITFRVHVFGQGQHNTQLKKLAPATITLLNGSLRDITIGVKTPEELLPGDTSDGLVADGLDRKYIENVLVNCHGGRGFVYKRGNLSRFFLRSRGNLKQGIFFAKEPLTGDNKCVEFWFESTGNWENGFEIEDSTNQRDVSGQHRGYLIAQNNGRSNKPDANFDAVFTGIGNDITVYTEYGYGTWHKSGLKASRIFYQNMSHPQFRDEANRTNIVSFADSALGSRTTLYEIFNTIEIQNAKMVGQLVLTQIGDRKFSLDCTGSTADQDLIIGDKLILKKGTMEYLRAYNIGATLNFGSVPANSSVERPIPIGVSLANSRVNVTATPSTPLPDGLLYNYFVKPDDLSNVTVRVRNVTGSAINAGGDIIWQALVYLR